MMELFGVRWQVPFLMGMPSITIHLESDVKPISENNASF